jgi:hypothetical protein
VKKCFSGSLSPSLRLERIRWPCDGTWVVRLPVGGGERPTCFYDVAVRLSVTQGRLSGTFIGPRGN